MKLKTLLTKTLLIAAMLLGGANSVWAYTGTCDFNSWVTTNLTSNGGQQTLTVTGDNIATADAVNVKVISDISTPAAFAFNGRFATDDVGNVYLRNGNSSNNKHNVNKGIQSKAANKHFSILNLRKDDVVKIVTGSGTTSFVSTNATVGGVQVVSGDRVGTDVDITEVGATTVCTMTADGNLDLKLGQWAVIMSITINEPISATLDHTAHVGWGNNKDASTVDAEQEYFNLDNSGGWAAAAFAKFSFTIPSGHSIVSATLHWKGTSGKGYGSSINYLNVGKTFDFDNVPAAGTDCRYNGEKTLVDGSVVSLSGGVTVNTDVTDAIKTVVAGSQSYIIFQWTGNQGGANLYGKGSADKPTLVIETAPEAVAAILAAIADVKANESSAAFATYIDGLSFTTPEEVYAAHTAWQIAQADAASSNDITKVIFDAAVSDFTRWNNARSNSGQQYTGAPDNKYFDAWSNDPSDGKQKIYGLPADTYTLKVATRASADLTDKNKYNVWVSGGSANVSVLGSHIGNEGGSLGNGWNWTILSFTLDAKADVEIGFYSCPPTDRWAGCDDWHLYKGTLTEPATITADYGTFSSAYALDFTPANGVTGVVAYYASAAADGKVTMTKVTGTVPANTGLFLAKDGTGDAISIPVVASSTTELTNLLMPGTGAEVEAGNYVFAKQDDDYGFYRLGSATIVPAGKAYLKAGSYSARMSIAFDDDETTGISSMNIDNSTLNIEHYYDLQGRRVAAPQKGLYIVNGKKVVIK